jgi:hypothetical protein
LGKTIPISDMTYLQTLQEEIETRYPEAFEQCLNLKPLIQERLIKDLTKHTAEELEKQRLESETVVGDLKKQMESMKEQVDMMARMLTATHDGKAQPVQLKDHPELPIWKMSDADASKILGLTMEQIQEAKKKLREMTEQEAKTQC